VKAKPVAQSSPLPRPRIRNRRGSGIATRTAGCVAPAPERIGTRLQAAHRHVPPSHRELGGLVDVSQAMAGTSPAVSRVRYCVLIACVLAAFGCTGSQPSSSERLNLVDLPTPPVSLPDWTITLAKGSCEGSCPVYSFTISAMGAFRYEGFRNVALVGERTGSVDRKRMDEIFTRLRGLGFDDYFRAGRSKGYVQEEKAGDTIHVVLESQVDAPHTTLTVTRGGMSKALTYLAPRSDLLSVEVLMLSLPSVLD